MELAIQEAKLRGVSALTVAGGLPARTKSELLAQGYRVVHVPVECTAWSDPVAEAIWLGPKRDVPGVTEIYFPDTRMSLGDLVAEARQFGKTWCELRGPLSEAEWNECVTHFYYVSCNGEPYDFAKDKDYAGNIRVGFVK